MLERRRLTRLTKNSQPALPVSRAARVPLPRRPGLAYLRYLSLVAEGISHRMVRRGHGKKDIIGILFTGHIGWAIATFILTKSSTWEIKLRR